MKLFSVACLLGVSAYAIKLESVEGGGVKVLSLDGLAKKVDVAAPKAATKVAAKAEVEAPKDEETTKEKINEVVNAFDQAKGAIAKAEDQLIDEEQAKAEEKIGDILDEAEAEDEPKEQVEKEIKEVNDEKDELIVAIAKAGSKAERKLDDKKQEAVRDLINDSLQSQMWENVNRASAMLGDSEPMFTKEDFGTDMFGLGSFAGRPAMFG